MSATELLKRITTSPEICHGKPCIRGLRYPVEWLLELLSGPTTEAEILADYPDLEPDDLRAAHAYAARLARVKRFEPLPGGMKFLVDAQLPRLLAVRLTELGQSARHTLDLPAGNRTSNVPILDEAALYAMIAGT